VKDIDPELLGATETFRELDRAVVTELVAASESHTYPPASLLFSAGQPSAGGVFILYSGDVEIRRPDGEVYRAEPGAILGLSNYLDGTPYASTARIGSESVVLEVPADQVQRLEQQYPALSNLFNRIIAERIRHRHPGREPVTGDLARPVRQVMKAPLATCAPDMTLRAAFELMQQRKMGSLGVVDHDGRLLGVLTFAGLAEAALLKEASPDESILRAACEEPQTVSVETPLWAAQERFRRERLKYLIVMEDDTPVGILSQTDILKAMIRGEQGFLARAHAAKDLGVLRRLYEEIPEVAAQTHESNRFASNAVRVISQAHLAIQRRCLELALEHMAQQGHGGPPVPYAMLIMGSGGRREMLLEPDQDNGIIIADHPPAQRETVNAWFEPFCQVFNDYLDQAGYVLCPGDIMARNPRFRKTLSEWCRQIRHLAEHPTQKAARWSNIVFDFATLHGDDRLTAALRRHVHEQFRAKPKLLGFMVEDDAEGRPALGLFNRLITATDKERKGKIDIKRNGLRIVVDAARIYALSAGVASCNTSERLSALMHLGVLSPELTDTVRTAYEELLDLLLAHQIEQHYAHHKPDKLIDPATLPPRLRSALRVAMRAVKRFQDQLQGEFGRSPF